MFILTVEDEFLISEYLRAILEGGGHRVIATFDADEAIEVLERVRDIQLVITDIDMPGSMDGLRLAAGDQRQVATDPLNSRDGIGASEQERIAPGQPIYPKAVWGG
jgi:CheY-like chemotaxis protein